MENQTKLENLIDKYKNNIPVPVLEIAQELGLKVFETSSLKKTESGLIRKDDDGEYIILVNDEHSATRKRFTIAHEIIHFMLHKNCIDESYITPSKQPVMMRDDEQSEPDQIQREAEANKWASKLLMPEDKFKEAWEKYDTIEEVANVFNVSVSAAAVRGDKLLKQVML